MACSGFNVLRPKERTLIKINADYEGDWPGFNTMPSFLRSLLSRFREMSFGDISVIEGDFKFQPASSTIEKIGLRRILDEFDAPFVPHENEPREGEPPAFLRGAQLINAPVMHTHTFAVISVATKNLYGLLSIYRERYHPNLSQKLLEFSEITKCFTIVDATVGVHGGSMRLGSPIRIDLLISGDDPISIDVVCARIMEFLIHEIPFLRLAEERGLIPSITVRGDFTAEKLPSYRFAFKRSLSLKCGHLAKELDNDQPPVRIRFVLRRDRKCPAKAVYRCPLSCEEGKGLPGLMERLSLDGREMTVLVFDDEGEGGVNRTVRLQQEMAIPSNSAVSSLPVSMSRFKRMACEEVGC